MKIEINIESQLESLWHKIGLEGNEIELQYEDLNRRVQELCKSYLQENFDRVQELTQEAEEAENEVRLHMKRFSIEDNDDDFDENLPLLYRIQNARNRLEMLREDAREQEEVFMTTFTKIKKCFETLEMGPDEQGEYVEEGDDFSLDKIDKMTEFLTELENEIDERQPKMDELCDELSELHEDLQLDEFEKPETLGNQTFVRLQNERDELIKHLDNNRDEAIELLRSIHAIEKVLKLKPTTINNTNNNLEICSDAMIERLKVRLQQLEGEKEKRISEFVGATKKQLLALWGELHIPIPSASDFPFIHGSPANKRTLIALESEVRRIENLKVHIEPMLDLIAAREEILAQYSQIAGLQNDSTRMLTSRKGGAGSMLLEEERIRKKYNNELPKIHSKLIPMLQEYQQTFGEPFMWDGENLLDEVVEMHRKEELTMMQSKARKIRNREASNSMSLTSNANRTKRKTNLANRAPFQLQEFMF